MALKPLNSVAGFSVGETPANIILANGDVTTNNITTTGKANLNAIANVIITGGSTGQVIQTDGVGNLSFVTISTSSLSNGKFLSINALFGSSSFKSFSIGLNTGESVNFNAPFLSIKASFLSLVACFIAEFLLSLISLPVFYRLYFSF